MRLKERNNCALIIKKKIRYGYFYMWHADKRNKGREQKNEPTEGNNMKK
jgi:hypothetical protein